MFISVDPWIWNIAATEEKYNAEIAQNTVEIKFDLTSYTGIKTYKMYLFEGLVYQSYATIKQDESDMIAVTFTCETGSKVCYERQDNSPTQLSKTCGASWVLSLSFDEITFFCDVNEDNRMVLSRNSASQGAAGVDILEFDTVSWPDVVYRVYPKGDVVVRMIL